MTKKWYEIKALAANGQPATAAAPAVRAVISIHDEIGGWGVLARDFIAEFKALPVDVPIELSVHSPGGSVFEALAMYHVMLAQSPRITARIEGVAASAATILLMAASRREAPANAYLMVHNPAMMSFGEADEMRKVADLLDKVKGSIAAIYVAGTQKPEADIIKMMDEETWMTGDEALAAGFIHAVTEAMPVAASLSDTVRSRFTKVPQALAAPAPAPVPAAPKNIAEPMAADEVAAACVEAGAAPLAALLIRAKATPDAVKQRLTEAKEITALAQAAGRPDDAELLVMAGVSVEGARVRLSAARGQEVPPINPHARADLPPGDNKDPKAQSAARLDFRSIYAARQAVNKTA